MTRASGLLLIWGFALWGALSIRHVPGDWGHGICGPWGCGPPLQSLAAMHAAWLVLLLPAAALLAAAPSLSRRFKRRAALALAGAGGAALVAIAVRESLVGPCSFGGSAATYLPQRIAFVAATTIDAPLTQLVAAGLALLGLARGPADHPPSDGGADLEPGGAGRGG